MCVRAAGAPDTTTVVGNRKQLTRRGAVVVVTRRNRAYISEKMHFRACTKYHGCSAAPLTEDGRIHSPKSLNVCSRIFFKPSLKADVSENLRAENVRYRER